MLLDCAMMSVKSVLNKVFCVNLVYYPVSVLLNRGCKNYEFVMRGKTFKEFLAARSNGKEFLFFVKMDESFVKVKD